jgi:hypothetical protein
MIRSNANVQFCRTMQTGFILLSLAAATSRAANPPLPTLDEIKQLYNEGDYRGALAASRRIVNLRDDALAGYDRHPVRMILAECQLRLRMVKDAADTLTTADEVAKHNGNVVDASEARSLAVLIRNSDSHYYQPLTGTKRERIDILNDATRKSAYLALFADRFDWCKKQQHDSASYESLVPMLKLADSFEDVKALEQQSSGATAQSDALGQQLSSWTGSMLLKGLRGDDKVMTQIERDTNIGENRKMHKGPQTPLSDDQIAKLKAISADCEKVPAAVDQLDEAFAQPLGASADQNRAHALNLVDRINAVLAENAVVAARPAPAKAKAKVSR